MSLNKLKSMLRTGYIEEVDDTKDIQRSSSSWLHAAKQTIQSIVPYGTFGKAPSKTYQLLLMLKGQESNVAGIPISRGNRIKKDCKAGEYGIGNEITGANIYFKEDGSAVIEIPKGAFKIECAKGNASIDADEINFNSGSKGVARLEDEVLSQVSPIVPPTVPPTDTDPFWTWVVQSYPVIAAAATVAGLPYTAALPTSINSKISSASSTVKAG